jgi:hypothetical protein
MKRSTPLQSNKPLKRYAAMTPSGKRMKSSKPKMTPARKAAEGQDCALQFEGCQNDRGTVVLCHLREFSGGGTGLKPHDSEAVFGCRHCHDRLDGRVPLWLGEFESRYEYIARALIRTLRIQREKGVLIYKGEPE